MPDANPFESPRQPNDQTVEPKRWPWSRIVFIVQAFVTLGIVMVGVSERTPSLAWLQPLVRLVGLLIPCHPLFPILIVYLAKQESQTKAQITWLLVLSIILIFCGYLGIVPLVQ